MAERGLVVLPRGVCIEGSNEITVINEIEPSFLRRALLYWDKLDVPVNSSINLWPSPETEYLQQIGILLRCAPDVDSRLPAPSRLLEAQIKALELRNAASPGMWAFGQQDGLQYILGSAPQNDAAVPRNTLDITLYNCFPSPGVETSLEDILEFKQKRSAELEALRAAQDILYQSVISAADTDRAKAQAIRKLELALSDIDSTTKESFARRFLGSLKLEINPVAIASATTGLASLCTSHDLNITFLASAIAVASTVKFELSEFTLGRKLPKSLAAYSYIHLFNKELD